MIITKANYKNAILPEHRGNPLIEALPAKMSDACIIDIMAYYPTHSFDETRLDAFERVEYLTRLKDLRQPLPVYLDCFRAVEIAIKDGYSTKNPLSPTTMNYLHYPHDKRPSIAPSTGFFQPKGSGITLIGESGVGKTSMVVQVLSCFPDTIEHSCYQGQSLSLKQVVWVKVDCPDDSSVRALCHKILYELDRKIGIATTRPASTIALLLDQIEARIKSSFLGILVIDEMQNLNLAKTGGADRLLGFLHNLVNNLGIPIFFCANPPFNKLLSKTLKAARRAESSGYFDITLMQNDEVWELFIEELWLLQWTNVFTPLTKALSDTLYELSIGNMDLAVRIYREAQRLVIGTQDERVTEALLSHASNVATKASRPAIDELRFEKISQFRRGKSIADSECRIAKEFPPIYKEHHAMPGEDFSSIPGDLSRPQHHEFAQKILEVQSEKEFHNKIKDPDLFQRAAKSDATLCFLKKSEILCDDPLNAFR